MAKRKPNEFSEYRYGPRSILRRGDRFRVAGGPIYTTKSGEKLPMYERGVFVFICYCTQGASKWIEARRADSSIFVHLGVGGPTRNHDVPSLRRRPYRITRKITPGQPTGRGRQARRAAALHAASKDTLA